MEILFTWKKGSDMRLYVMLMFLSLYLLFFGMVASNLMNNDRVVQGISQSLEIGLK